MMKRWIAGILAACCMASLAGCGGGSSTPGKEPAAADIVTAVAKEVTFKDSMMTLEESVVPKIYSIDMAKLADQSCYTSATRATAEEISVFRAKEKGDLDAVKQAVELRIADQKLAYENYVPEEMVKINAAVTYTHGNYVILVMADDTTKVEEIFEAQFQ